MNISDDLPYLVVIPMLAISSCIGSCSRMYIKDDVDVLRKRVHDLDSRVYRIELKTKISGEVVNEARD